MAPNLKSNRIEIRLEISHFDDISHDDISQRLGLQPSRIYVKGQQRIPGMGLISRENRWLYNLYDADQVPPIMEVQLDRLSSLVKANPTGFASICKPYTCGVFCIVTICTNKNESTPAVYLERRHVRLLTTLSALFDVDIYLEEC